MPRLQTPTNLEDSLRRVLTPPDESARLPANVLGVPHGWIEERRAPTLGLLRAAGIAAVVLFAAILAIQIPNLVQLRASVGITQAARVSGVAERQLLETADGFVGVRMSSRRAVEFFFLPRNGTQEPRVLAVGSLGTDAALPSVVTMTLYSVSCSPSAGLHDSDFVFGYSRLGDSYPDRFETNLRGSGTWYQGLFLFAVPGGSPAAEVSVAAGSTSDDLHLAGRGAIDRSAFDHGDACAGELLPD